MAILENPKHERFAQELAKGKSQAEAYETAGYAPSEPHASRLASNGKVQERVAELLSKGAERAEITRESLMEEAAQLQRLASDAQQFSAANGALKLKAELSGHYVQRKEDVTPRRNRREIISELAQFLERRGTELGSGEVPGTGTGRADDEALPTVPGHGTA